MTPIHTLWLPTLLSAVVVFVTSAFIHMALQWWHRSDYGKIPQEDTVMDLLRPVAIPPGDYMVPNCTGSAEMRTPEFKEKRRKGPVMLVTVMPSGPIGEGMGKSLFLWLVYLVVVSHIAAYLAGHVLPFGASHRAVFRVVGVASFLGFSGALCQMSIWYRRSWLTTAKSVLDGLLYAAITAAIFACLWPR